MAARSVGSDHGPLMSRLRWAASLNSSPLASVCAALRREVRFEPQGRSSPADQRRDPGRSRSPLTTWATPLSSARSSDSRSKAVSPTRKSRSTSTARRWLRRSACSIPHLQHALLEFEFGRAKKTNRRCGWGRPGCLDFERRRPLAASGGPAKVREDCAEICVRKFSPDV